MLIWLANWITQRHTGIIISNFSVSVASFKAADSSHSSVGGWGINKWCSVNSHTFRGHPHLPSLPISKINHPPYQYLTRFSKHRGACRHSEHSSYSVLTEDKHKHSQEEHWSLCFYALLEVDSAWLLHDVDFALLISCEPQHVKFKVSVGLHCEKQKNWIL